MTQLKVAEKKKNIILNFSKQEKQDIEYVIKDFNSIVHRKSKSQFLGNALDNSATWSVEGLLGRFADDAVQTTFGMVWTDVDIPVTIVNREDPDQDLSGLATLLVSEINKTQSKFKNALKHAIRCYLEYGSGWMYVFPSDSEKTLVHRTFSALEVDRVLDCELDPTMFLLKRSPCLDEAKKNQLESYSIFEETNKKRNEWSVFHVDGNSVDTERKLKYQPFHELSLTGIYSDVYPLGYGIKALADLKRYDNTIKALTEAAGHELNPLVYEAAGQNSSNTSVLGRGLNGLKIGTKDNPMVVNGLLGQSNLPYGTIPYGANSVDAWRLFELSAVNIRESFNFVNRLLTVKDNAQMTATEVNTRAQSDLMQVKSVMQNIFDFLEEIHRAQLFIMKDLGMLKDFKNLDINNLEFIHSSVFKKQAERERVGELNIGLDLIAKTAQVVTTAKQSGIENISSAEIINEISKSNGISLLPQEEAPIQSLIDAFAIQSQDVANV